jgi:hypothetical protein
MQWYRDDQVAAKTFGHDNTAEYRSNWTGQGNPLRILQVMNDLSRGVVEENSRSCEVENVLTGSTALT